MGRQQRRKERERKERLRLSQEISITKSKASPKPPTILPLKATTEQVSIKEKAWHFSESNFVWSGGVAMIVTAFGFLVFNASAIFSGILFIVGLIMISVSLHKHNFFEGKGKILQQCGNPCISIVIATILAVSWVSLQPAPIKLRAYLVPAGVISPVSRCEPLPPDAITIYYGSAASYTTGDNFTLIGIGDKPLISAKKNSSGLLISLRLFDIKGNEIANIVDNKFIGNVADNLDIQNTDPHTIDIFDKNDDRHIFHIRYLNDKAIKILGTFYYPNRKNPIDIDEYRVLLPNGGTLENMCLSGVGKATMIGF